MKTDCIILATPIGCHTQYDAHRLNPMDQLRVKQHPQLAQRIDWQSSRFLKQQLPPNHIQLSLGHKKGHAALIASTEPKDTLGIDIEYAKQRDFLALSTLCCSCIEQQWLAQQTNVQQAFYQLWTLKEALIKAYHGQLSDMPTWSLVSDISIGIEMPNLSTPLQAHTAIIHNDWYLSVLYPAHYPHPQDLYQGFLHWQQPKPIWQRWPTAPSV